MVCEGFKKNEKFYDFLQILSNNVNYNAHYLKKISDCFNSRSSLQANELLKEEYYLDNPNQITVDNLVKKLSDRVKYLPFLFTQLEHLSNLKKLHPDALFEIKNERRFLLVKEKTSIIDFTRVPQEDFLKAYLSQNKAAGEDYKIVTYQEKTDDGKYYRRYTKVPITIYSEDEAYYYQINFERKNLKVTAFVEIGYDYPIR